MSESFCVCGHREEEHAEEDPLATTQRCQASDKTLTADGYEFERCVCRAFRRVGQ